MYQALKSLGRETQLVIYPGESHALSKPSYRRDRMERYLAWYGKYLANGWRRRRDAVTQRGHGLMRMQRRYSLAGRARACSLACHRAGEEPPAQPDPDATVLVHAENHYRSDVSSTWSSGTQRRRLGTVTALGAADFTFPWRRLQCSGTSRLMAHPIAGARAT